MIHQIRKLFMGMLLIGLALSQSGCTLDTLALMGGIYFFETIGKEKRAIAEKYYEQYLEEMQKAREGKQNSVSSPSSSSPSSRTTSTSPSSSPDSTSQTGTAGQSPKTLPVQNPDSEGEPDLFGY